MLMNRLFDLLREQGYKRTSLSVQKDNPAVGFYKRLGYGITKEKTDHVGHEDFIMVKNLLENTELFSGKADVYAKSKPGYTQEVMDYIATLVPTNAVFADIGAGTGKFTELLVKNGNKVFAVEPNADMRKQLTVTLANYPNAEIIAAPAENTTLPDNSVDAVTCASALHWFEPDKFRAECRRIGKNGVIVIAAYNRPREEKDDSQSKIKLVTNSFFTSPTVREFDNPQFYTRESWVQYMSSHSHNPLPTDSNYTAHIEEVNAIFDRESVDGVLRRDVVTKIYSERFEV
jgi:ubiquinone/menaquinone biosynthesis C-methylase UbiE